MSRILPRSYRGFYDVPEWPYGIRAKAIKLRLEDDDDFNYLGLYNAILNHVFQTATTAFSVVPSFLAPGVRGQINVPPSTFLIYHRDRPVFILQLNAPLSFFKDPLLRQRAEWNLKEQINAVREQFVTNTVYAACCFGKWVSYYEITNDGPAGYDWARWASDPEFERPHASKDQSPLKRWETNILMPNGRKELYKIVDKIKGVVDALRDEELELEGWQDEES